MAMMVGKGGGRAGRRGRGGGGRHAPMSEINVTPMVDVMLVLLIIFMVAAPLLISGVPIKLPVAKGAPLQAPQTEPLQISVTQDGLIFLGEEKTTAIKLEELGAKLTLIAKTRGGAEAPVFVRGDNNVPYGQVVRVLARVKEAGFRKFNLLSELQSAEGG